MANFWDGDPVVSPLDLALADENASPQLAALARSIYQQESSSGKNTKTSNDDAVGGMQIRPPTFREVADKGWDINDPVQNARAGIRYLARMLKDGGGDPRLAAIGYYGGPGAIDAAKHGHAVIDPQNPEAPDTFSYADSVMGRLKDFGKDVANAVVPEAQAAEAPWVPPSTDKIVTPAPTVWSPPSTDKIVSPSRQHPASKPGAGYGSSGNEVPSPQPAREPSEIGSWTPQNVLRQVGLTGRAALNGVAAIPNALWNGPANAVNSILGTHIPLADSNAAANFLGLPQPANGKERFAQDVASSMATAGPLGVANKIVGDAGPVVKGITDLLSENVPSQIATAALGASGSSGMRELGYGPGYQLGAGLILGGVPALAHATAVSGIRNALVGGEAGRQRVLNNILAFKNAGTAPTIGQATEGRLPRAVESLLSRAPGGAGVMAKKAMTQSDEMRNHVDGLVHTISKNVGPVEAGESITNAMNEFKDGIKNVQKTLYGVLDQHIAPDTPIPTTRTQAALHDLNQSINGAENVSKMFQNSRISGILNSFEKDLKTSAQSQAPVGMGGIMSAPPPSPLSQASMPYEAIKKLRTLVGQEIDNSNFTSDVPRSKWRALYAALSDDLGDAADEAGPKAAAAWRWANGFTKMMSGRLESLKKIVDKDAPERVFDAAMSGTSEGDTVLKRVVDALPKSSRRDVAATVIARMGRATPGNQNDTGEIFSPNTFLTNWNRMSESAKKTLFGRIGEPHLLDNLRSVAKAASNIREGSKVFANPSGTGGAMAQYGTAGALAGAIGTGHLGLAAGIGAEIAANNVLARGFTSPRILNWALRPVAPYGSYVGTDTIGAISPVSNSLAPKR